MALGLLAVSFGSLVTLDFFTPTHSCFCACLHFYSLKLVAPKIWKRRASHILWLIDILIVMPASPVYLLLPCANLTKNQLPSSSTFSFLCCSFFSHRHHQPKGNYVVGPLFSGTKSRLGKISKTQEQSPYRVFIWHHPRIVRDWSTILDVMQPLVAREKHIFPDWLKRGSWRFLAVSRWNWLQRGCCTNILLTVALVTIANCCNLL